MPDGSFSDRVPVEGLVFIGPFVSWRLLPARGQGPALGEVTVAGSHHDGEPFWFRAWVRPEDVPALQSLHVGERLAVSVRATARSSRGGEFISWQALAVQRLDPPELRSVPSEVKAAGAK